MATPRVIVLRAPGTNCDEETAEAWNLAGASAESWHVGRLLEEPRTLDLFQILTIPGGFSYGDDLGAGRILATHLARGLGDALRRFHDRGGLILGVCNGFQVLVRCGLLPGPDVASPATLAHNLSGRFESRWVTLLPRPGVSPFVSFSEPLDLPVAHGEGRFLLSDPKALDALDDAGRVVLKYADDRNEPTQDFPANPNGSSLAAAGVCDATGRIFGLMPHPERFVSPLHHPRWTRLGDKLGPEGHGLKVFRGAIAALA
ncbi:phosphoribosylformylglycinamidine synthase I [Planctomyces sp. SH-PL62]|uniref:phosphoribosylformylglycinamidine synthase I n=1 Tax=Planctomyces sp. SH-PL62 TaxID=1636152 RepID=UPI00078E86A0|nr:phosphoribosylformylglycinamidine synthase I [Planctomyces sp. SH-PL62]AMV38869.1 Phosphoribosylformylglycinamidine synthase 1 [Planctomyces sp. SH-PL62]